MNNHKTRLSIVIDNEQRFFRNVEYLRKQKGLSQERLCELASDDNFTVNYRSISVYGGWSKRKYTKRASMYYLAAFACALGLPLVELMNKDYSQEDGLKGLLNG